MTAAQKSKRFQKLDLDDHPRGEPLVWIQKAAEKSKRIHNLDIDNYQVNPKKKKSKNAASEEAAPSLVAAPPPTVLGPGMYQVTVYNSRPLAEMIAAGKFDYVDSAITTNNFPNRGKGKSTVEIEMVHLNRDANTDEVLKHMDEHGLRPVTLPEMLALVAKYPDLHWRFHIICLGTSRVRDGDVREVLQLVRFQNSRKLELTNDKKRWHGSYRFPAVRK